MTSSCRWARVKVSASSEPTLRQLVAAALDLGKGQLMLQPAPGGELQILSSRRACPSCGKGYAELDPRLFSYNSSRGWCESCFGTGLAIESFDAEQTGEEAAWLEAAQGQHHCESCEGHRLNPLALAVKFRDLSIAELGAMSVDELSQWFGKLRLSERERAIATDLLAEIRGRLAFLQRVGLTYLSLDRAAPTLSGGETQRLRLAAQLGSNLRGVCYVLDEPTIGLHPRDNRMLLDALGQLAQGRNTLVVVEHDEETIRRADHVLDLGPGAGSRGGHIVASGTVKQTHGQQTSR